MRILPAVSFFYLFGSYSLISVVSVGVTPFACETLKGVGGKRMCLKFMEIGGNFLLILVKFGICCVVVDFSPFPGSL